MAKLTDTQLIVLSNAAARDDGIAVVPNKMNKAAASKVAASLVARKLAREVRSKHGMPVWREDKDDRSISLIITRAGRDAIGVDDEVAEKSPPASKKNSGLEPIGGERAVRHRYNRRSTRWHKASAGDPDAVREDRSDVGGACRCNGLAAAHDARRSDGSSQAGLLDRAVARRQRYVDLSDRDRREDLGRNVNPWRAKVRGRGRRRRRPPPMSMPKSGASLQ